MSKGTKNMLLTFLDYTFVLNKSLVNFQNWRIA